LNASTEGLKGLSDLPTLRHAEPAPETPHKKRRFSSEAANDLIFFAVQLCVLAIGLAIVWNRIEATNQAVLTLLKAQETEITIAKAQAADAHEQALQSRAAERTRATQLAETTLVLQGVLDRVSKVQGDITATLDQIRAINQSVLVVSEATKTASVQAAGTAQSAASAAAAAHNAAGAAAANSRATRALVRSKVATAQDKVRILREEAQLNAKQKKLDTTIRQVKQRGPTLWQRIFP
jgi:hypothetical protein